MFLSFYVFGIPLALLFAFVFKWNVVGLWAGLSISLMTVACFFFIYIVFFINWEKEVELAKERVSMEDNEIIEEEEEILEEGGYSKELNENLEETNEELHQDSDVINEELNENCDEINIKKEENDEEINNQSRIEEEESEELKDESDERIEKNDY